MEVDLCQWRISGETHECEDRPGVRVRVIAGTSVNPPSGFCPKSVLAERVDRVASTKNGFLNTTLSIRRCNFVTTTHREREPSE